MAIERSALRGCDAKLRRATEHLNALDTTVTDFLKDKPYGFVGEFKPERSEYVFRVQLADGARERIADIGAVFGDMVHNLRSALDHLIYELVRLRGRTPRGTTAFPIYDTEPKHGFACATTEALRGVGAEERALIERLQPYNRLELEGNALSYIRRWSNRDKHRTLVDLIAAVQNTAEMPVGFVPERDVEIADDYTATIGRPLEDGAPIFRMGAVATGSDPKVRMNGDPPLSIAFPMGDEYFRYDAIPPTVGEVFRVVRAFRPFFDPRLF